ncbi:MAG: translocation/assembly module TamB [Gemmatimonadota bacterium]|nr:translocation/assembly module TamB [Gemmatimonadota bacterium]
MLDISTPAEPGFALVLAARDARLLDNEMGRLRADADLAVDGPFDAVRVTGDIHLRGGVIRPPETDPRVIDLDDPQVAALVASSGIAPEGWGDGSALLDNLRVEIGVRIARNTWVRTPEANVEIHTPEEAGALALRMARGQQTFALEGTVVTDRGEYEFSGRRFELSHGSVNFLGTPEINPLLQITAEHEVPQRGREALAIQINVAGTLQEPRVTLESNAQPPLSQSDLLSYLAFGRSSSALLQQGGSGLDQEGGGGSGNVGALATQKLTAVALGALVNDAVADLERGGARKFGLDVFRIAPTDLPSELRLDGARNLLRGTELEAGRYLTPRWFVAGQGRATALPGVRVEYRTPAGFRWMTTWEPRYQPAEPSFSTGDEVGQRRVLGTFLFWEWRY